MSINLAHIQQLERAGVPASPGVAIGRAFVLDRARLVGSQYNIQPEEIPQELRRFLRGLNQSRKQLKAILRRLKAKGMDSEDHTIILEAHLLMIEDHELIEGVKRRVIERQINAEWALREFLNSLKERLSSIDDEYLQERTSDIDHIGQRILRNLLGKREMSIGRVPARSVIVSHDLTPADTVHMLRGHLAGFVTELGGRTSHVAILARSMQIPAVVGAEDSVAHVATGDLIILDGDKGRIIIRPSEDLLESYRQRRTRALRHLRTLSRNRTQPPVTRDGLRISLSANVEKLDELEAMAEFGAEGIGLYRTEYLFLDRKELPDEEEQYQTYRRLAVFCSPHPVVIRTLDVGADKGLLGEQPGPKEHQLSPALGLRGVRYCLRHPELFEPQLRALLRAANHGNVRIMVPMVSTIEEIQAVKELLYKCARQLHASGQAVPTEVPLGVMIETPAAALMAHELAPEVDFFSIGTNDLIQYTMAIDRMDERLAELYQPVHPAVLRLISMVLEAGSQHGIDVSMCGEMAGEPLYTRLLLGLGLKSFSMSPLCIPSVKHLLRGSRMDNCQQLAQEALKRTSGRLNQEWLLEQQKRLFPERF